MSESRKLSFLNFNSRSAVAGFSLMELLVVLVVVSLVSALLIPAVGQVILIKDRALSQELARSTQSLAREWFRDLAHTLVPDHPSRTETFKGSKEQLSGLTLASLTKPKGIPVLVTLRIVLVDNSWHLTYQEGVSPPWVLMRWGVVDASFEYMDKMGYWFPVWPPEQPWKGPQLPTAIRVTDPLGSTNSWIASHVTRDLPRVEIKDFL